MGRQGIGIFIGQILIAIAGVVGIRVITELAQPEVVGEATLLLGIAAMARTIFISPIGNSQIRFHPEFAAKGQLRWFTRKITQWAGLATLLLSVVLAIVLLAWQYFQDQSLLSLVVPVVLIFSAIEVAKGLRISRLSAERRFPLLTTWTALDAWAIILVAAAALMVSATTASFILGQTVGSFLGLLVFGILLFPKLPFDSQSAHPESDRALLRRILRYGLPFVPLAVVSAVSNIGDRYIIEAYYDKTSVGQYVMAYSLASRPFIVLGVLLSTIPRPVLFQAVSVNDHHKARRVFQLWLGSGVVMSALGVVGFVVLGPWIACTFLAAEYRAAAPTLFVWISLGYAFQTIVQILENRLLSIEASRALIGPAVVAAALNILLNLALIPRWGIVGAARVTSITFAIQMMLLAWSMMRSVKDRPMAISN